MYKFANEVSKFMDRFLSRTIRGGLILILIAVPLIYSSMTQDSFSLPKMAFFQLAIASLLVLFALRIFFFPEQTASRGTPLDIPLLAWLAWFAIAALCSLDRAESLGELIYAACLVSFFFLITRNVESVKHILIFIVVIAAIGVWESAYGIAEWKGAKLLYESNVMEATTPIIEGGKELLKAQTVSRFRILGTFGNANHLATYLVITIPLLIAVFTYTLGAYRWFISAVRRGLTACFAAALIFIIITGTRLVRIADIGFITIPGTWPVWIATSMLLVILVLATGAHRLLKIPDRRLIVLLRWGSLAYFLATLSCLIATGAQLAWISAFVCLAIIIFTMGRKRWSIKALRGIMLACLAAALGCLVFTGARAAWLATLLSISFLVVYWFRKDLRTGLKFTGYAVVLLICLLVLVCITEPKIPREFSTRIRDVFTDSTYSQSLRLLTWRLTPRMIAAHPFCGSGPGIYKFNFLPALADHLKGRDALSYWFLSEKMNEAHNEYFHSAVETGIPGLMLFLLVIVCAIRTAWKKLLSSDPRRGFLIAALLAAILGVLTNALSSIPFHVVPTFVAFWAAIALLSTASRGKKVSPPNRRAVWRFAAGIGLILFAIAAIRSTMRDLSFSRNFKTATSLNRFQDFNGALPHFRRALEVDPSSGRLKFYYGSTLIQLGRYEEGAALLEESKKNFQDIYIYKNLGIAYDKLGQQERAVEEYRRWREMGISSNEANNLIALIRLRQGRTAEAEELFKETLRVRPWDWTAYTTLGTIQMDTGRLEEAIKTFQPDAIFWRNPEAYTLYGVALIKAGRYEDAERSLNHSLSMEPHSVRAHNNLGALYYATGRLEEAIIEWQEVLTLDPHNAIALKNLETARQNIQSRATGITEQSK